jgi:hypothetical protein
MEKNQEIFEEARRYLLEFPAVTEEMLQKQLCFPEQDRPATKNALLKKMIEHATNRQGMPNAIGDVALLAGCLENFDPGAIINKYSEWESLFDAVKTFRNPTSRMDKTNAHGYWVIFCKSVLSVAKFVNRFDTIDDFNNYVYQFITETPDTRLALPLILKEEIFGYQFALACDFVKENVSPLFVKPDIHIKTIFIGIGKSQPKSSDFQIFRDVISFAESINQVPYAIDKLFWLIGSGNFYWSNKKVRTDRQVFIDRINSLR